jgi:hypothetical protein
MTTQQLSRLDGRCERVVRSRLRALFALGYVTRPKQQHVYFGTHNPALVYALTMKAARFLADSGAAIDDRLHWVANNNRATAAFLEHTIEVAAVMVAFRLACSGRDGALELADHHDLIPYFPAATQERDNPFELSVTFQYDGKPLRLRVDPDRLFSIHLDADRRHNFALELDRGTMSVSRRRKKLTGKSSFRRKIVAYYQAWRQGEHSAVWGFKTSFRILTVTTSPARIRAMLDVQRDVTRGHAGGLFLYSTMQRLEEHGVFGPAWQSSDGDGISLLAQSSQLRS